MTNVMIAIPCNFLAFLSVYRINLSQEDASSMYKDLLYICFSDYYTMDKDAGGIVNAFDNIFNIIIYSHGIDYNVVGDKTNSIYEDFYNAIYEFVKRVTPSLFSVGFFSSDINNVMVKGVYANTLMISF